MLSSGVNIIVIPGIACVEVHPTLVRRLLPFILGSPEHFQEVG